MTMNRRTAKPTPVTRISHGFGNNGLTDSLAARMKSVLFILTIPYLLVSALCVRLAIVARPLQVAKRLGADDEGEDQAQNCKCFSKCEAKHCDWLQDALCFWLTCNTIDVSSEDHANADSRTNCSQAVADHIQGAMQHVIMFLSRYRAFAGRL